MVYPPTTYSLPALDIHSQLPINTDFIMSRSQPPTKWIDEETYRTTVLAIWPSSTENEADENLKRDAQSLGLVVPVQKPTDVNTITSSLSATTISSEAHQESILSQSTGPTSCGSSERRPSTSLSQRSSRLMSTLQMPTMVTEMERKRHSGFKSGLRKMTGFRKKKSLGSNSPSMTSIRSHMTGNTTNGSVRTPPKEALSIKSRNSDFFHDLPISRETIEPVNEVQLEKSLECEQLLSIRTQQLEEKRRFLEYQTRLVRELLEERDKVKAEKRAGYQKRSSEQEEQNEKAVEELEARQLEDELKQQKEHETEKRAMQTRLKHMEAYCHTPSPPNSPLSSTFDLRPSIDSVATNPERHVTQQHYESLAQAYHMRDNMDSLHASRINVLRGKQKRALTNFMLKKERELEQLENDHNKELASIDSEYAQKEGEIRQEFELKRAKLEARWKLQALIEKTRLERSTGLKYDNLPDVMAVEA